MSEMWTNCDCACQLRVGGIAMKLPKRVERDTMETRNFLNLHTIYYTVDVDAWREKLRERIKEWKSSKTRVEDICKELLEEWLHESTREVS